MLKRSARLTYKQAEKILTGNVDFLLESKDTLLIELYSKIRGEMLRPRTIVSYDREAYIFGPGNVRLLWTEICVHILPAKVSSASRRSSGNRRGNYDP